ncbi:MAG: heavy metal-binding domain-containing protein [Patescibacteria group bacterium]
MKVYVCPMHPEVRETKPGSCPKCGMDLIEVDEKAHKGGDMVAMNNTEHHRKMAEDIRKRFLLDLHLTKIVLFLTA